MAAVFPRTLRQEMCARLHDADFATQIGMPVYEYVRYLSQRNRMLTHAVRQVQLLYGKMEEDHVRYKRAVECGQKPFADLARHKMMVMLKVSDMFRIFIEDGAAELQPQVNKLYQVTRLVYAPRTDLVFLDPELDASDEEGFKIEDFLREENTTSDDNEIHASGSDNENSSDSDAIADIGFKTKSKSEASDFEFNVHDNDDDSELEIQIEVVEPGYFGVENLEDESKREAMEIVFSESETELDLEVEYELDLS